MRQILSFVTAGVIALAAGGASAQPAINDTAPSTSAPSARSATATHGMVVSQDALATRIGVEILEKGGNAVDAAVAVGFALAVTMPRAGNLGGGGFMVIHLAEGNRNTTIDYREAAPAGITRNVFLNDKGEADPEKSRNSALAVGVPGTVAGLAMARDKYGSGKFTLAQLIAPAIRYARQGILVENDLFDTLALASARLSRWPSSARIFTRADGMSLAQGDRLVQNDLAASLETIARGGSRAFYDGLLSGAIVGAVQRAGGVMTTADLKAYHAVERPALRGTYRGHDIISMGPPSSGGVLLLQMLNILEGFPLGDVSKGYGFQSVQALHVMIEAMKLAYADRAEYLGDSDKVEVPLAALVSKQHGNELRAEINPARARPSLELRPNSTATGAAGGNNTTHFSVVDRFGNAVANTYSLNFNYGLGLVAEGTGILLNNTLDDFAAKPGAPNAFGLVGSAANAPGGGKRPLSSMTPTIVLKNNKVEIVTGAPGGSRIITAVLQVIVNVLDFRQSIAEAVAAPRIHHQWLPDTVTAERTLPPDVMRALEARGHTVRIGPPSGAAHSIAVEGKIYEGAADGRSRGALAAGF
jgi:gamma-glutamyltranspeptidase/glutathione hydrolase